MATTQDKAPSFFNFLKEGLLLPSRNRGLFMAACALILASNALLALRNDLAVQPLGDQIQLDVNKLNATQHGSPEAPDLNKLLKRMQNDTKQLLLVAVGGGYHTFDAVVREAVRIVVLLAAVLTYSGEQPTTTFVALLGQAKVRINGPLVTLAFVYVMGIANSMLLMAMATLLAILMALHYFVALASLLIIAAVVCSEYLSFLCSFSVVVAVAEPRCHGASALVKAWRLVKGKKRQVALYLAITAAMSSTLSSVRTLSRTSAANSVSLGLLMGFVYAALQALVQLFSLCAMTAFYYERRENIESQLGPTGYAKLSTKEAIA